MKLFTGRALAVAAVCCGLAACGGSDPDSGGIDTTAISAEDDSTGGVVSDDQSDAAGTSSPAPGVTAGATAGGFDGTWESNCARELPIAESEFLQATLIADGDAYTTIVRTFGDSDCSVPVVPGVVTSDFSVEFPGGSVATPFGDATFIDVTLEALDIDGFDAFAIGQQTGVASAAGFDIFVIGSDGFLYFGSPADNVDDRPTEVQTNIFFTLQ